MSMAFVTRCPYCGAVWRLPDQDTAERGPVRCSVCQNSFDATCNLAAVPEERFPHMPPAPPAPVVPAPAPTPAPAHATAPAPAPAAAASQTRVMPQPAPAPEAPQREASSAQAAGMSVVEPVQATEPQALAQPAPAPEESPAPTCVEAPEAPAADATQNNQLLRLHGMTPGQELQASRPDAALAKIIPAKSKPEATQPQKIRVAESLAHPPKRARQKSGAFASVFTAFVLLLILAATLAVIFNQKIIALFPQTQSVYNRVCGKIPCPGFFLRDISAFVVNKVTLRAVDESGNYQLEITLINGSDMPQAIPALDIELVDDTDTTLMRKSLAPSEYLSPASPVSLAAGRTLTVRFSMQTNVTPARCIVKPVYLTQEGPAQ